MGESIGSYIRSGEYIKNGDYLVSPNGMYFALVHSNGILSFYAGSMDNEAYFSIGKKVDDANAYIGIEDDGKIVICSDLPDVGQVIWNSNRSFQQGNYILFLENSGNLEVYDENNEDRVMWKLNGSNSVSEIVRILDINYNFEKAIIDDEEVIEIAKSEQKNYTDFPQKLIMEYSKEIEEKAQWICFEEIKVSDEDVVYCSYPDIVGDELIVEDNKVLPFTTTEKVVNKNSYNSEIEININPNTKKVEVVKINNTVYHIPFIMTAIVRLEKGDTIENYSIRGLYTINKLGDLFVDIEEYKLSETIVKEYSLNEENGRC